MTVEYEDAGEPIGRVTIATARTAQLHRRSLDEVPAVIDEMPALGALGTLLPEGSVMEVRGAAELRVKESDRITALARGFRAMGAEITEYPDGFRIDARPLQGAVGRRGRRPPAGDGVRHRRERRRRADDHHRRGRGRRVVSRVLPGARAAHHAPVTVDKIYLVGFMAAGKSTVARALSARLGWRAEDVDELIEARERRTIADIFAKQGEPYFRAVEREILKLLLPLRHAVVATGGGTFMDAENRAAMNWTVCRSGWTCRSTCSSPASRPTAAGRSPPTARQLERLFAVRQTAYAQAHVRVDAGAAPADEIAEQIVDRLDEL